MKNFGEEKKLHLDIALSLGALFAAFLFRRAAPLAVSLYDKSGINIGLCLSWLTGILGLYHGINALSFMYLRKQEQNDAEIMALKKPAYAANHAHIGLSGSLNETVIGSFQVYKNTILITYGNDSCVTIPTHEVVSVKKQMQILSERYVTRTGARTLWGVVLGTIIPGGEILPFLKDLKTDVVQEKEEYLSIQYKDGDISKTVLVKGIKCDKAIDAIQKIKSMSSQTI